MIYEWQVASGLKQFSSVLCNYSVYIYTHIYTKIHNMFVVIYVICDWCVLFVKSMHFKVPFWAWHVVRAAANCPVCSPLRDQLLIWLQQHKDWQARHRGNKRCRYDMMTHVLGRTWMLNMFYMGMFEGNGRIWNLIIWYLISLHWSFPFLKAHVEKVAHLRSPSCIPGISMGGLVFLRGIYETVDPSMELQRLKCQVLDVNNRFIFMKWTLLITKSAGTVFR